MTVSATNTKSVFVGDGTSNQEFTWTFDSYNLSQTEIRVRVIDTSDFAVYPVTKTLTTDYTVNLSLKKITTTGAWTPTSDHEIHIERVTARTQSTDQPVTGAFSSSAANEANDRAALLVQDLRAYAPEFLTPALSANTAVTLGTSSIAIYTTSAISAPSGMSGSLVCVAVSFSALASPSPPAGNSIAVECRVGPLGTVSDPIAPNGSRAFGIDTEYSYSQETLFFPHVRVDDGDIITIAARVTTASGTISALPNIGGALPVIYDSY